MNTPTEPVAKPMERPRLTWSQELVTMLLSVWVVIGLFVDGWAHVNLRVLETFFTPWHALFYSGFLASSSWILWQVARRRRPGVALAETVPQGYGLALVGLGLFALGGVADGIWHSVLGIESGLKALHSPSHIILFAGGMLIGTSPLRAAWSSPEPSPAPSLKAFLPVLLSLTLTTASVSFFFMYLSTFRNGSPSIMAEQWASGLSENFPGIFYVRVEGISSILLTNLLLIAPLLLALKRWQTPFWSFTFLFGAVGALMSGIDEFAFGELIVASAVAGFAADAIVHLVRPTIDRPGAFRTAATLVPFAFWSLYFITVAIFYGLAWPPEMWSGMILWAALEGFALSLLMSVSGRPRASRETQTRF